MYLESDTLLSANDFEKIRKMCLKIYHLDSAKFLSAPGSAWPEPLKWTKVELEFLSDIDMLLMV